VIRHWHIVHRSQKELLPMAAAFLDFVRAEAPRLIAEQPPGWCPVPAPNVGAAKARRK
jgi:hypothetical protein